MGYPLSSGPVSIDFCPSSCLKCKVKPSPLFCFQILMSLVEGIEFLETANFVIIGCRIKHVKPDHMHS